MLENQVLDKDFHGSSDRNGFHETVHAFLALVWKRE